MRSIACSLLVLLVFPAALDAAAPVRGAVRIRPDTTAERASSIRFEPNVGQFSSDVSFTAWSGPSNSAALGTAEFTVAGVRIGFRGASPERGVATGGSTGVVVNHFRGADPRRWRLGVRSSDRVLYRDLYPGVDAIFYGSGSLLEYDLIVASGADPAIVTLAVDAGVSVAIDAHGDLLMETAGRTLRQRRPVVYQEMDGQRTFVPARYEPRGPHAIGFDLGAYDTSRPLVIDPIVGFSTYLGGSQTDLLLDMVTTSDGRIYVVGYGDSPNLATVDPVQAVAGGRRDMYVGKLDQSGAGFEFLTYLGGDDDDEAAAVGLDAEGNIYVAGSSDSRDFPLMNPLQPVNAGMSDIVVLKLGPSGDQLLYSTYLGNFGGDFASDMKVDDAGNAYVIGGLTFPILGGDAVVVKLNPQGSELVYGVSINISGSDQGSAIDIDAGGNAYIAGRFRLTGAGLHAFLAKLNATGDGLLYAIGFGGGLDDFVNDMDVDAEGNAYAFGATRSTDFPRGTNIAISGARGNGTVRLRARTASEFRPESPPESIAVAGTAFSRLRLESEPFDVRLSPQAPAGPPFGGGMFDAFVTRVNPMGDTLVFSRYLGGAGSDSAASVAVDPAGAPFVAGGTSSADFPLLDSLQPAGAGGDDAYLAKLDPGTGELVFSTLFGGAGRDVFLGIAFVPNDAVWVCGSTQSNNFPVASPLQASNAGGQDGVLVRLDDVNFALVTTSATLEVRRGDAGTLPISIRRATGFAAAITVRAPSTTSIKVKFKPASVTTDTNEARFTFKIKKKAVLGTHTLVFTGEGPGGEIRTAAVNLVVSQ